MGWLQVSVAASLGMTCLFVSGLLVAMYRMRHAKQVIRTLDTRFPECKPQWRCRESVTQILSTPRSHTLLKVLVFTAFVVGMSPQPAEAGKKSDQRRIDRAAAEIYRTGIPNDPAVNGMSHSRELRLNAIPVVGFFGAWIIGGKSVAFRVDPQRGNCTSHVRRRFSVVVLMRA